MPAWADTCQISKQDGETRKNNNNNSNENNDKRINK